MAFDIRKEFGRDQDKVNNGAKVLLDADGASVTVRHRSAEAVQQAIDRLSQQERMLWDDANVARGRGRHVIAKVLTQGVVVGWEGLEEEGKEIVYTIHVCQRLLADPMYDPFLERILSIMTDDRLFGLDDFEGDSKNSPEPSDSN